MSRQEVQCYDHANYCFFDKSSFVLCTALSIF